MGDRLSAVVVVAAVVILTGRLPENGTGDFVIMHTSKNKGNKSFNYIYEWRLKG